MKPADCQFRGINADGIPVCNVVFEITEFPLHTCHTNDSACTHCLTLETPPQAPNRVVASMACHAALRNYEPANGPTFQRMQSILRDEEPTPEKLPCVKRGLEVRQQLCKPCQAGGLATKLIPVYSCSQFRECTLRNTGTVPKVQACNTCQSRQPEFAQIEMTTYPPEVLSAITKK